MHIPISILMSVRHRNTITRPTSDTELVILLVALVVIAIVVVAIDIWNKRN